VEDPPPSLNAVYLRLGVTQSIMNANFPGNCAGPLDSVTAASENSGAKPAPDLQTEIRENRPDASCPEHLPSVPRVASLLSSGSLRE